VVDEGVAIALVQLARELPQVSAVELAVTFNEVYSVNCGDTPVMLVEEVRLRLGASRARVIQPLLLEADDLDMSSWEAAFRDQERDAEAALATKLVALSLASEVLSQADIDRVLLGSKPD
jgi:hypothetical protein